MSELVDATAGAAAASGKASPVGDLLAEILRRHYEDAPHDHVGAAARVRQWLCGGALQRAGDRHSVRTPTAAAVAACIEARRAQAGIESDAAGEPVQRAVPAELSLIEPEAWAVLILRRSESGFVRSSLRAVPTDLLRFAALWRDACDAQDWARQTYGPSGWRVVRVVACLTEDAA